MKIPKILSKTCLLAAAISLMGAVSASATSVIDAPHNESNNIACGRCHTYSLWWTYSPTSAPDIEAYRAVTDTVCNSCHGPGMAEFNKLTHSSTSMGRNHSVSGAWDRMCVDCHDPHLQEQLTYLPANPDFSQNDLAQGGGVYLAQGTMDQIADNGDNTTSFTYSNLLAAPPWDDMSLWTQKSGNSGRGLMLVLNYAAAEQTYEIIDANSTTSTLTVQSGADPIDPTTYNGSNFGVIYGQLIKTTINTRDELDGNNTVIPKTVRFLDARNDGFVDTDLSDNNGVATGICQVCHYNTLHYNANGTENANGDPISHYTGRCTACHEIANGFKPQFIDHDSFINRTSLDGQTTCGSGTTGCHIPPAFGNVVTDIHKFDCAKCHNGAPPTLQTTFSGPKIAGGPNDPPNWPTANVADDNVTPNQGFCGDCHGAYFTAHQHKDDHSQNSYTGQPQVVGNPNCTDACHFHDLSQKDIITGVHDGAGAGGDAPCNHCHDVAAGGQIRTPSAGSVAQAITPGDCTGCHTTIASDISAHPKAIDHTGQVEFEPSCYNTSGCHSGNAAQGVHATNSCATCHATNWALKPVAYFYTDGTTATCTTCHPTVTATDDHWVVVNSAPALTVNNTELLYTDGSNATAIDANATVSDSEQNWDGGTLVSQITSGSDTADTLSIAADANVTISGPEVWVNGVHAADLYASSKTGSAPFTIALTAAATNAEVEAICRHLTFYTNTNAGSRTVTITVTDGAGGQATASRVITVIIPL